MTEKRYCQKDSDDWEIFDNGKHFAYAHSGYNVGKIIHRLNEQSVTIQELERELNKLGMDYAE